MIKVPISNGTLIRLSCFSLFLILFAACQSLVPAQSPPQLSHTPGAPISITDNQIDAGWFTLDYPDGWRVVTSIALEPLELVLVSPDDAMVINIYTRSSCAIPDVTPEPETYWRDECRGDSGGQNVHVSGRPDTEFQAIYDPIFDAVIRSIEFR